MDAAEDKLRAEAEKLRAEAKDLNRHPLARPGAWLPILIAIATGVGGLMTAYYQWQVKQIEINQAVAAAESARVEAQSKAIQAKQDALDARESFFKTEAENSTLLAENEQLAGELQKKQAAIVDAGVQLHEVQASAREAQSSLSPGSSPQQIADARTQLEAVAQSAGKAAEALQRQASVVYVQFRGTILRETVREMQSALRDEGYSVPGIERVDGGYNTEVRYFSDADESIAQDVAGTTATFLKTRCNLVVDVPAKRFPQSAPPGQVEVWMAENCS